MRFVVSLLVVILLSGCSAMVMGGGSTNQSGRQASVSSADSTITTTIRRQLQADSSVSAFNIGVKTYKGTVTLTGTVSNLAARDRAGDIAKGTNGVVAVNNLIEM